MKLKVTQLFLLPPVVFVGLFIVYPLLNAIQLSFTVWDGFRAPRFIGLTNYFFLAQDRVFITVVINNFIWVVVFLALNNLLGLLLAGSIDILGRRLGGFFRSVIYLSVLLPNVVVSYLFLALYDPNIGLIDGFFKAVGLNALGGVQWLADPKLTLYSILASSIWQYAAFPMLIFIAAFASISPSLYEAATIDGANQWQIFWKIKVPIIRPVIITILALTWIWNSQPFSQIWTLTRGGPGHASDVIVTYIYQVAFSGLQLGYASTISVILFLMIFPVVVIFLRLFEK
jgi:raffinose/stachyose/melibiose transport system permease protein